MASDAVLEAILDTCDDAVIYLDRDGRITRWNRSAERQFGHGADEVVGQAVTAVFPEHVREAVDGVLRQVRSGDRAHHVETEILRRDGMPMPVSLSLCPVAGQGATSSARCSSAATSPSSGSPRRRWPRSRPGCARARRWRTSAAGCGTCAPAPCSGATSSTASTALDPARLRRHVRRPPGRRPPRRPRPGARRPWTRRCASARPFEAEYRVVRPDGERAGRPRPGPADGRLGGRGRRAAGDRPGRHRGPRA